MLLCQLGTGTIGIEIMRLYKIEILIKNPDTGAVDQTEYYVEKSKDVRAILGRLYNQPDMEVLRVVCTPEFEWTEVEVS